MNYVNMKCDFIFTFFMFIPTFRGFFVMFVCSFFVGYIYVTK